MPGLFRCIVVVIHARRGSRSTAGSFHRSSGVIGHSGGGGDAGKAASLDFDKPVSGEITSR
ncbi:hypothetical protein ACEN9Z_12765, partial [Stenotrophomonas geniculata]